MVKYFLQAAALAYRNLIFMGGFMLLVMGFSAVTGIDSSTLDVCAAGFGWVVANVTQRPAIEFILCKITGRKIFHMTPGDYAQLLAWEIELGLEKPPEIVKPQLKADGYPIASRGHLEQVLNDPRRIQAIIERGEFRSFVTHYQQEYAKHTVTANTFGGMIQYWIEEVNMTMTTMPKDDDGVG